VGFLESARHPVTIRGGGGRTIPRWGLIVSFFTLGLGVTFIVTHGSAFGIAVGVALVATAVAVFAWLFSRGG
jgi:hypothetical protein